MPHDMTHAHAHTHARAHTARTHTSHGAHADEPRSRCDTCE